MLVSFAIFNKGGLILYQHSENEEANVTESINTWLGDVYLNPTKKLGDRKASIDGHPTRVVVEWEETSDLIAVALYPGLRHEEFPWIRNLLLATLQEFQIFYTAQQQQQQQSNGNDSTAANSNENNFDILDSMDLFDKTFQVLFKQHKSNSTSATNKSTTAPAHTKQQHPENSRKGGKEKRQWHDGKGKVTKETMAALDKSKDADQGVDDNDQVALAEARAAYLPTDADLANFDTENLTLDGDDDEEEETSFLKGLFQQVTGQKVLTKQDLEIPLKEMHKLLTTKNVASDIAQQICDNVEQSLVGKKLNRYVQDQDWLSHFKKLRSRELTRTSFRSTVCIVFKRLFGKPWKRQLTNSCCPVQNSICCDKLCLKETLSFQETNALTSVSNYSRILTRISSLVKHVPVFSWSGSLTFVCVSSCTRFLSCRCWYQWSWKIHQFG